MSDSVGTTNVGDPPMAVDPSHRVQVSIRGKRFEMAMEVALTSSMLFRLFFYTKWNVREFQKLEEMENSKDSASSVQDERKAKLPITLLQYVTETHPEVLFQTCMSDENGTEKTYQKRCSLEKEDRKKRKGSNEKVAFSLEVFLLAFYTRLVAPVVESIMYECSTKGLAEGIEACSRCEKRASTASNTLHDDDGSTLHHTHSDWESPAMMGTTFCNEREKKAEVYKNVFSSERIAMWRKVWEVLQAMENNDTKNEKKTIAAFEEKGALSSTTTAASSPHSSEPLSARSREGAKVETRSARVCSQDFPAYRFSLLPLSPWMTPQSITFEAKSKTWVFKFSHRLTIDDVRERLVGVVLTDEEEVEEGHTSHDSSLAEQSSCDKCRNQNSRPFSDHGGQDKELPSNAPKKISPRQQFTPPPLLRAATSTFVSENVSIQNFSSHPLITSSTLSTCAASSQPFFSSLSSAALSELQPWVVHALLTYFQQKQENTSEEERATTSMKTLLCSKSASTDEKEVQAKAEELHRRLNEDPWLQLQPELAGVLWVFLRRLARELEPSKTLSSVEKGEKETVTSPSFPTPPVFPLRWAELNFPQKVAVGALVQVLGVISLAPLISMAITAILPTVSASFRLPTGCAETCADLYDSSSTKTGGEIGPFICAGSPLSSAFQSKTNVFSSLQAAEKGVDRLETEKEAPNADESKPLEEDLESLLPLACEKCGTLGHRREECVFLSLKEKSDAS